jgi:hypothetical protein
MATDDRRQAHYGKPEATAKIIEVIPFAVNADCLAFFVWRLLERLPEDKRVELIGAVASQMDFFDPTVAGRIKAAIDGKPGPHLKAV